MQLTWDEIQDNARRFSIQWKDSGNEKQKAHGFVRALLSVFGADTVVVENGFENAVRIGGHDKYIDFIWPGKIAIEMKSRGKDLTLAFHQLQNYMQHLSNPDDVPDLWLVCDFESMRLCRRSTNEVWNFKTKDLRKHIKRFADIAGYETERIRDDQVEVNVKAAEKMAKLHDALKSHGYAGHDLEVYLVRLLFCLFADDTGIFPKDSFCQYLEASKPDGSDLSERIGKLFEVLNMPEETRTKRTLLSDELKRFRYINGGLFENLLPSAEFDAKMRQTLVDCVNFDWNKISPAIFGAMFQGVMDKTERRELGAHYTSEENILKLINPLFMDELWKEFDRVKTDPTGLDRFHSKISRLKFLDPACGCGNFLIITYRELRTLEFEVLKMKLSRMAYAQASIMENPLEQEIRVSVNQFYGIEYEDFPCQIAQVGMWLMDHQMNNVVADFFGYPFVRLPLTESATIVHGNALRIDWESVVPKRELSYILGNPPFVGNYLQSAEQKTDMAEVFKDYKNYGVLDYVCSWYKLASDYVNNTMIRAAFVSTNSISQGDQPSVLWQPLVETGIKIDFGYRTFRWSNEAKGKAAVHCVIIGFSGNAVKTTKAIYSENEIVAVNNINQYLIDAPNIFLKKSSKPICEVPPMVYGNKPVDGGNLIVEDNEYEEFLAAEPNAVKYIKRLLGAKEFIDNSKRWCLWLKGVNPNELRSMPLVMARIARVKEMRLSSKDVGAQKLADTPTLFRETNNPESAILIPCHSSENRRYIPIGFIDNKYVVTNAVFIIPDASLYHFGVLTSNVHMAWVRAICGRIKSDYRYSKDIVYNNFPWPDATDEQTAAIEKLAQDVLDARTLFPDSSLADLYDPLTMPPELLKAHRALDTAVMKLYGFSVKDTTEAGCVAALMKRYRELVEGRQSNG